MKNSFVLRMILFLGVLAILLIVGNDILIPNWNYPRNIENVTDSINGFNKLEKNSTDVFFLGTSHMEYGISPMELYREFGYVSYNLATSSQPSEVSLFFTKRIFKRQRPKVLVYDVSNLFFKNSWETAQRYVLDTNSISADKISLINDYVESKGVDITDSQKRQLWLGALFPLYMYHDRWADLQVADFKVFPANKYYLQGYVMTSEVNPAGVSVEGMNDRADQMMDSNEKYVQTYVDGRLSDDIVSEDLLYSVAISAKAEKDIREMKKLCEINNCRLLLVKVPCCNEPNYYASAWTSARYEYIKSWCATNGLDYFDLLYDTDISLDWNKDTRDGGIHLNLAGAVKATHSLGEYLSEHYSIPSRKNIQYETKYERYKKASALAYLQMEEDLALYLCKLNNWKENTLILISAKDDMEHGLSNNDKKAFVDFGLQFNFDNMHYRDSYIAVMQNGVMKYETCSNRVQWYSFIANNGVAVNIGSGGLLSGNISEIDVNGINYSINRRGINIVVYDLESGLVIDSANFDTYEQKHLCTRYYLDEKLYAFENYLLDR